MRLDARHFSVTRLTFSPSTGLIGSNTYLDSLAAGGGSATPRARSDAMTPPAPGPAGRKASRRGSQKQGRDRLKSSGFTLIELMAVLAVIGLMVSLLIPAVQSARESARRTTCMNQLRQMGLALQMTEQSHGQYPSDGWGFGWVTDGNKGVGVDQPGGWVYPLLPALEMQQVHDLGRTEDGRLTMMQTPLPILACPSRRGSELKPYTLKTVELRNVARPKNAAKTDYAICAGDREIRVGSGPTSDDPFTVGAYRWPEIEASGISFVRSTFRARDVTDGLSHTMAIGEKALAVHHYAGGESLGDDQSVFIGDDADIRRWTEHPPLHDGRVDDIERFGSAHAAGLNVVMCGGSMQTIDHAVDSKVFADTRSRRKTAQR